MGFTSFNSKTTDGDRAAAQAQEDRAGRRKNARVLPTIYHESYGEVTRPQLAAYRKHNVSPSDHNDLGDEFGEEDHDSITRAVKDRSPKGYYNAPWPPSMRF